MIKESMVQATVGGLHCPCSLARFRGDSLSRQFSIEVVSSDHRSTQTVLNILGCGLSSPILVMLELLPEEILINILSRLEPIEETLTVLPLVCRSWAQTFGPEKDRFWLLLATNILGLTSRGQRRCCRNSKKAFFKRYFQQKVAKLQEADRKVLMLTTKRLANNDCTAYIRKQIKANPGLVNHKVSSHEHRTLLHYACWYGRVKTVQFLVQDDCRASIWELDDSHASPLLIAAWAGKTKVVRLLLSLLLSEDSNRQQDYLNQKGVPPLTSSCGGKGPKTALCWARRKGFIDIVRLLERAGANGMDEE